MKKLIIIFISALISAASFAQGIEIDDSCDKERIKLESKNALIPYKSEYARYFRYTIKPYEQVKEFSLKLYIDVEYRFVFNSSGLPDGAKIIVTDRERLHKKAEVIWESDSDKGISTWDITEEELYDLPNTVHFTIYVPALTEIDPNVSVKGCLYFNYGYIDEYE